MPLKRRLPKGGFTPPRRRVFSAVNLSQLDIFPAGTEVTPELLREKRIIRKLKPGVKILAKGKVEKKLVVWAHDFSAAARKAIEAAGGSCQHIKYVNSKFQAPNNK